MIIWCVDPGCICPLKPGYANPIQINWKKKKLKRMAFIRHCETEQSNIKSLKLWKTYSTSKETEVSGYLDCDRNKVT